MSARGIEQERRDFKRDHPTLYQYILDHEVAKVWESAGDTIGGNDPGQANYFYRRAGVHTQRKTDAQRASQSEPVKVSRSIMLGDVYQRTDGAYAIPVIRDNERSACCNSGHASHEDAQRHGAAQVASWGRLEGPY